MATPTVPSYPVIYVDVRADGSAHINVAGRHINTPTAPLTETRGTVTRYAVQLAITLGRAVRMTTTDPAGTFHIAVHPDGTVTDLTAEEEKPRRRSTEAERTPSRSSLTTPSFAATPPQSPPTATLIFSTGDTATIQASALVGRRPHFSEGSAEQLVQITDNSQTVSKSHFRIEQIQGRFWITDLGAANGTTIRRAGYPATTLTAAVPHELHHGDTALIGGAARAAPRRHRANRRCHPHREPDPSTNRGLLMMATVEGNPGRSANRCHNAGQGMPGPTQADVPSFTRAADRFAAPSDRTSNETTPPVMDDDTYWDPFPDTLAPADVAKILSVGRPAVLNKLKNGTIPGHLIVGSWIIFKAELRAWLESTSNQTPTAPPAPVDVLADYPDEMTYRDLMTLMGKTKRTIYSWLNTGEIPAFHAGNRWIIRKTQLRQKLLATSNQDLREE